MTDKTKKITVTVIAILLVIALTLVAFFLYEKTTAPQGPKPTRILTWWGYFDSQKKIKEIETLCNTKLQIVEYLNTDELKDYAAADSYDLYVYLWSYHQDIEQNFSQQGPNINQVVEHYHSTIKERYHQANIPPDTVFFQHAVQMFVYDKNHIGDLDRLTARAVLNFANVGKVYLMDDMKQMDWLIKKFEINSPEENWVAVYRQFQAHRALRANPFQHKKRPLGVDFSSYVTDYLDENLVLGYLDSGELMNPHVDWGVTVESEQRKLAFGIHPSLSHVSSDVLALKSHATKDQCVAQLMASRQFLRWVSKTSFYFSPFEERIDDLPDTLQQLTQAFYGKADELPWLHETQASPLSRNIQSIWKQMTYSKEELQQTEELIIKWDPESGIRSSRLPPWLIQLLPFLE